MPDKDVKTLRFENLRKHTSRAGYRGFNLLPIREDNSEAGGIENPPVR